mgnify:CR=1 FL=1
MEKEISKGTQKFIWHMVSFIAVFIIALVILCRVLPEPNRTTSADPNSQVIISQTDENISTDFDSVKERVDRANNTTGKEIKSLYTGDGKSSMQKQLETRLFFNTIKNILICVLLAVVYTLIWNKDAPYSVCEGFVDENTELIPAWRIMMTQKKNNSMSVYQHFVNCCTALGVRDVEDFFDRMITLDYIIANEDRHFNNFGALRNAETLEWIGMAPIYDSGSSLGYDKLPGQIRIGREVGCKPFKNHHEEQIKLVRPFDWLDLSKLDHVDDIIREVLSQDTEETYVDENRIRAITDSEKSRLQNLRQIISEHDVGVAQTQTDMTTDDVKENIAENYSSNKKI